MWFWVSGCALGQHFIENQWQKNEGIYKTTQQTRNTDEVMYNRWFR